MADWLNPSLLRVNVDIQRKKDYSLFQDLENQMDVAEKRRQTLLKDFLEV